MSVLEILPRPHLLSKIKFPLAFRKLLNSSYPLQKNRGKDAMKLPFTDKVITDAKWKCNSFLNHVNNAVRENKNISKTR